MIPIQSSEKQYGIFQQSVFGTAAADNVAAIRMACDGFTIPADSKIRKNSTAHGSRVPVYADYTYLVGGAQPKFTISGYLNRNFADILLAGCCQSVVESGTTVQKKIFKLATSQPDFKSNAGYFFTVFERYPTAAQSYKTKDCICTSLTISSDSGDGAKIKAEMIGKGLKIASTPSGTWVDPALLLHDGATSAFLENEFRTRFTLDLGGGVISPSPALKSWDIVIPIVVEGIGADGAGGFEQLGYSIGDPTYKLVVAYDANTKTAQDNAPTGLPVAVRIGYGNATAGTDDGDFDIVFTGLPDDPKPGNDKIIYTELSGKIVAPNAATDALTITMANYSDRNW